MKNETKMRMIEWTVYALVILVTVTAFSFQTFETKEDAKEKKADISSRLDRIESKLDDVIRGMR